MTDKKKIEEKKERNFSAGSAETAHRVLVEPWITEKSHQINAENKYIFKVEKGAPKPEIKKAVEKLYSVKVLTVNVVNVPPKKRYYGRKLGWKQGFRKAIVTLKKGDKIELFEGV